MSFMWLSTLVFFYSALRRVHSMAIEFEQTNVLVSVRSYQRAAVHNSQLIEHITPEKSTKTQPDLMHVVHEL